MLPVAYETKPIADLAPGTLALVGNGTGNHIALAIEAGQEATRLRRMLSLSSIEEPLEGPKTIYVSAAQGVGLDLGTNFSFDFDIKSSDVIVSGGKQKYSTGSLFLLDAKILMLVDNPERMLSGGKLYIDVSSGEVSSAPEYATAVEIISWKLLLHSAHPASAPLVLAQWLPQTSPSA